MQDVIVGLLAIAVGALFCFRGYLALRVIIPIWGAFAGFVLGAGLVSAGSDDGFLRSVLGWVVGFALALLFGLIAYLYYEVSVVIAMMAIGFALGTSLMVAIGIDWAWIVAIVGIAAGLLLGIAAIAADLPMVLLTVLSALAGASTIVGGVMLLTGALGTDEITESASITDQLHDEWWWYVMYVVIALVGIVAQVRAAERLSASMREAWAHGAGGGSAQAGAAG
jgi:hypothetical protein